MEKEIKGKRLIQFLMGLDECYANVRGQILLMSPMPTVAKAYSMIRQEEKQREGNTLKVPTSAALSAQSNYTRNSYNGDSRFGNGNSRFGESSSRNSDQRDSTQRRSSFKKGVICGNCGKEGHYKEECYQLVGYPVGHPLHGKFKPTVQTPRNNYQDHSMNKAVNMAVAQGSNVEVASTSGQSDAMSARMDQLQNQLNKMMLLMLGNKEQNGTPSMKTEGT